MFRDRPAAETDGAVSQPAMQGEQTALGLPPKGGAAFPVHVGTTGTLPDGLSERSGGGLEDRQENSGLGTTQSGVGDQDTCSVAAEAANRSGGGLQEDVLAADATQEVVGARAGANGESTWEVGEARAAAVRAAVQKSVATLPTPTTSSAESLGPGCAAAVAGCGVYGRCLAKTPHW